MGDDRTVESIESTTTVLGHSDPSDWSTVYAPAGDDALTPHCHPNRYEEGQAADLAVRIVNILLAALDA